MYAKLNTDDLWNYFSHKLKTILRVLDQNGNTLEEFSSLYEFHDDITPRIDLQKLLQEEHVELVPLLFSVDHHFVYSLISLPNSYVLVGPTIVSGSLKYRVNFNFNISLSPTILRIIPFHEFLFDVLTIHNSFGKRCTELDIAHSNLRHSETHESARAAFTSRTHAKQEDYRSDYSYYREKQEQECIENGDLEQFLKTVSENISLEASMLENHTLSRIKSICISMIAISCRSAIKGGVNPENAYTLEDSYIQQLDKLDRKMAMLNFVREVQTHYVSMVHEIKQSQSSTGTEGDYRAEKCKAYIHSHLHDHLNVAILAKELHYNPDYLSHMFKQVEGISLSEYIMNAKIKYAKDLLRYTNDSYSKIASDLGFSSQSHLGKQFKLLTGSTMHKYRLTHSLH